MPPSLKATAVFGGLIAVGFAAGVASPSRGANRVPTICSPAPRGTAQLGAPISAVARASQAPLAPVNGRHTSTTREVLASVKATGAFAHAAMVRRIAQRYSVEWKLVMAIIASESGGDPAAVSPMGAVGLMQLMPQTARDLGVDPFNPEQNVDGAVRYLSALFSTFGSVDLTLIAYNAGPGFAQQYRQGGVELGAETRGFLIRVGRYLEPSAFARGVSPAGPGAELAMPAGSR